jgi:nucleotide sugar dehydrogenase
MAAVDRGFDVVGYDVDTRRVDMLAEGRSFIDDISNERLIGAISTGRYIASADPSSLEGFDVAVITVPTPLKDRGPDMTYVVSASEVVGQWIKPGALVILESTTYPGTTDELTVPLIEKASGLVAGKDFFAGFSPERIDPGNAKWNFENTTKVIAGIDAESLARIEAFYVALGVPTVSVSSTRAAELAKLLENTFRHVNIAMVNELALVARDLGVDIWEVIDAAATKPFGFMKFTPGPGVGGHCLPIDPSYLSWQVHRLTGERLRFIEAANEINEYMPKFVVERAREMLNARRKPVNGSRIMVMGLAYKKNSGDSRESPSTAVIEGLIADGADVVAVDPLVAALGVRTVAPLVELTQAEIDTADLVIVITEHDDIDWGMIQASSTPVLDTRHHLELREGLEYM